jgi:hypothetical protein
MEGTRKIRRPRKRGRDEGEEDLNIMRIKNRQAIVTDRWEWWKTILDIKVLNRLLCSRRRKKGQTEI